jgi:hypothetical protein
LRIGNLLYRYQLRDQNGQRTNATRIGHYLALVLITHGFSCCMSECCFYSYHTYYLTLLELIHY